jgi:flavin-dependent dehydrogenase
MDSMPPVHILGAGLSGLATALLLARQGLEVEVRDRSTRRSGRFWGGFQVLENGTRREDALAELSRHGLDLACEVTPLRSAVFFDQDLRRYEVGSDEPYAYLIRRGEDQGTVDAWLRAAAAEAGVTVRRGVASNGWQPRVVATGPARSDGVAQEVVFRTDHPDTIVVLFDPELTPTGYSYLFVHDGFGTMGAAQVRRVRELRDNARAAFDKLRRAVPMRMDMLGAPRGNSMNFAIPRHLCQDGTWYVGEAAGVQDFLFGLGNRLAIRCAALVADALGGVGWRQVDFESGVLQPMRQSVLGRALYERAGPRWTSRACRHLASGDFRERLLALQRPSRVRGLLAGLVMAVWRDRTTSRRPPVASWCRRGER